MCAFTAPYREQQSAGRIGSLRKYGGVVERCACVHQATPPAGLSTNVNGGEYQMRLLRLLVLVAIMVVGGATAGYSSCPVQSWTLWAGQTQDVGTVEVTNDATNVYVTYTLTAPGATFGGLHLWVGNDLNNLPKTKTGNPEPGQFPYKADATGLTTYKFTIPLAGLSITDITGACPLDLNVVAHAEVNNVPHTDGSTSNETAFGGDHDGPTGSRWWYYAIYHLCCDTTTPPDIGECKTAFAKGGWVFTIDAKSNPENLPSLKLIKNRWGWAINLTQPGTTTYNIWAGAGLNKTSNGVKVGTLEVDWDGSVAKVTYTLGSDYVMKELHIYAADFKPTTTAPGQYGYTKYFDPPVDHHTAQFWVEDTNGDGIWIIAHAISCALEE